MKINKPVIAKDFVPMANNASLYNKSDNIGCRMLSLCSGSTNEYDGEGTTTSTILAGEIVKRAIVLVDLDFHRENKLIIYQG